MSARRDAPPGGRGADKALVEAGRARRAIALAHCRAHARRRFCELAKGGAAPVAVEALRRIAELDAVEAEIRGQDADTREATREVLSRPLVLDLKPWLEVPLTTVAGRSPPDAAIRDTLVRREGLTRFLGDGRIEPAPTRSSVRSRRSRRAARTPCSAAPTKVRRTGSCSPR